jgi:hypothetical protein
MGCWSLYIGIRKEWYKRPRLGLKGGTARFIYKRSIEKDERQLKNTEDSPSQDPPSSDKIDDSFINEEI